MSLYPTPTPIETMVFASVPEQFRSRLSSIQIAVEQGGPRLGDLEAGSVAAAVSTSFSVISGGLACIAGVLVSSALLPGFVRHERTADPPPDAP